MSRSSGGTKVFMGRLPYDTRTRDIEKFFREYGFSRSIRDVTVKTGYAFVEFDDSRDADDAVYELNRKELLGSRITLEHARPGGGRGRDSRDSYRDRSYREYRARSVGWNVLDCAISGGAQCQC